MSKKRYVARWWDGPVKRKKTFARKGDRDAWTAARLRQQALGGMVPIVERDVSLAVFVEDYWRLHAVPNLEKHTRDAYRQQWAKHLAPRLGGMMLRQITPGHVQHVQAEMLKAGVGEPTVRKAVAVLQSILALALVQGRITSNPAAAVRKPSQQPSREVQPIAPIMVERLRARLELVDATLVSMLAYAGLRPQELLALEVRDLAGVSILVRRKNVDGELLAYTKTRKHRQVRLLPALAHDLRAYQLATGIRSGLLFPREDGEPWRTHTYNAWRKDVYQPAARAVGLPSPVPYDLRGSFASLLIWEGQTMLEVAAQLGHGTQVCEAHYARVFADFNPAERTSADEAIAAARKRMEATG